VLALSSWQARDLVASVVDSMHGLFLRPASVGRRAVWRGRVVAFEPLEQRRMLAISVLPGDDLMIDISGGDANVVFDNHASAGFSQVTGDSFPTTTFANPANSLTVNFGDANGYDVTFADLDPGFNPTVGIAINGFFGGGDETINIQGLGSGFAGNLAIDGQDGSETVNFQTGVIDTRGGALDIDADNVNINTTVQTGGGNVDITTEGDVNFNASGVLDTAGGLVTITGLNQGEGGGGGTVTADGNGTAVEGDGITTLSDFSVPSGSSRLLVVHVGTFADVTAVTFAGTSMSPGAEATYSGGSAQGQSELWYLPLGDGASSTNGEIRVTGVSGGTTIGAASFQGVDQTTPVDNPTTTSIEASQTTTSLTVPSEPPDLVIDGILFQDANTPPGDANPHFSQTNAFSVEGTTTPMVGAAVSVHSPVTV